MPSVASARREWEEGSRRFFEAARDPVRADVLHRQVDAVTVELRRRVGGTFTLAELAEAYAGAERWVLGAVEERAPSKGWARTASLAADPPSELHGHRVELLVQHVCPCRVARSLGEAPAPLLPLPAGACDGRHRRDARGSEERSCSTSGATARGSPR